MQIRLGIKDLSYKAFKIRKKTFIMYNGYIIGMQEEITTVVRIPLSRLEEEVRTKHVISLDLLSVSLDKDAVVLQFGSPQRVVSSVDGRRSGSDAARSQKPVGTSSQENLLGEGRGAKIIELSPHVRMRRSSRRNRMKTRGWNIVTKMQNSKGQTVAIYEPFVEALRGQKMSRRQMENAVAAILRENGNRPGPVSIEYYLSNTLEYLAKEGNG
jgi:hypothetical protein